MGGRSDDTAGDDFIAGPHLRSRNRTPGRESNATFDDNQVNNMVGGVLDFGGTPIDRSGRRFGGAAPRRRRPIRANLRSGRRFAAGADQRSVDRQYRRRDAAGRRGGLSRTSCTCSAASTSASACSTRSISSIRPQPPGSRWTQMTGDAADADRLHPDGDVEWPDLPLRRIDLGRHDDHRFGRIVGLRPGRRHDLGRVDADSARDGRNACRHAPDGTVWVLGGGRDAPNPSNEVDIYDPVADAWTLGPAFTAARRNFAADIDPATGNIWAVGGYDVDGDASCDQRAVHGMRRRRRYDFRGRLRRP